MMPGMLAGALLGLGIVILWSRTWPQPENPGPFEPRSRFGRVVASRFAAIGLAGWGLTHLIALSLLSALVFLVLSFALSGVLIPSFAAACGGACLPHVALSSLARKRTQDLRQEWPDVIDMVHSAVRAGLSLPDALSQLADKGPEVLQPAFREFARDYQATGNFSHSLDRLKERLSDPVGDRVVEALRVTREVGGTDIGTLLRTLSTFLRDDARTRAELEARQSWTINGAKLALIAPWVVLALMLTRPEAAKAYNSSAGAAVMAGGALVSVVAYRVMLRIGRLPQDERVLA